MTENLIINSKEIKPRQVLAKDLSTVCMSVYPFVDSLDDAVSKSKGGNISNTALFRLIGQHTENCITFCAAMTDLERDEVASLDVKQLFELMSAVISVNTDFFLTISDAITKLSNAINQTALQMAILRTIDTTLNVSTNGSSVTDTPTTE